MFRGWGHLGCQRLLKANLILLSGIWTDTSVSLQSSMCKESTSRLDCVFFAATLKSPSIGVSRMHAAHDWHLHCIRAQAVQSQEAIPP